MAEEIMVVIPCLNEAATIAKVVQDFRRELPEARVVVMDNGSGDGSPDLARKAGAEVFPVTRKGKGYVVMEAFDRFDPEIFLLVDGDDTYPAESARALIEPLRSGQAEMVVASRLETGDPGSFRPGHRFGNRCFTLLVSVFFGQRMDDILSGYRAFRRELADRIYFLTGGFEVETEMTLHGLRMGARILEVPIPYRNRPEGSLSKLNTFRDGYRILLTILAMLRDRHPLIFFSVLGGLWMTLAGVLHIYWGWGADRHDWLLFILVLVGLLSFSTGFIVHTINARFLQFEHFLRQRRGR